MSDDWDLHAVVRGCTTTTTTSTTSTASCSTTTTTSNTINSSVFPPPQPQPQPQQQQKDEYFLRMQDLYARNGGDVLDLFDLYKPFYRKSSPPLSPQSIIPFSSLSVLDLKDLSQKQNINNNNNNNNININNNNQILKQKNNFAVIGPCKSINKGSNDSSPYAQKYTSRSKRRKNQMKKIVELPADSLSSDMWSWRKYGQKPIKGSPYPRGYYKCSTSKGCLARKQVERSRSDPGMFIVTYTSEHNHPMPAHRNSLAGSSRPKPSNSGEPGYKQSGSPPLSPEPEKFEIESFKDEIIEDEIIEDGGYENVITNLEDDFFYGLEEIDDINNPHKSIQFPWLTNNTTDIGQP